MSSIFYCVLCEERLMIYLDNGATSFPKPRGMVAAMEECMMKYCGNPGRSGHSMSMKTGEEVYRARKNLAKIFHIEQADRIVFTKNTTEALNLALMGSLKEGDHVITTSMEHNSVLRPLKTLEKRGVFHSILRADRAGRISPADIEKTIRPNTKIIAITAASNVTGTVMPLAEIGKLARKRGILFLVDGAQAAGSHALDVEKMNIGMLAVPGHKGLLGPLGTGALYVDPDIFLSPLLAGGTGTESKSRTQPGEFPEGFEAGTLNAPGIIGLGFSAAFVDKIGVEVIEEYEKELIGYLDEQLDNLGFVKRYGPPAEEKTGITLFNVESVGAEEVTTTLSGQYGIAVRGGYHCAGLAHKTIGTWDTGAVRVSVGPFNGKRDIDKLIDAVWEIGKR